MNGGADIAWDDLQHLFSVVICFDEAMRVVYASDTVHRYLPEIRSNPLLEDIFEVLRPGKLNTFSDASASMDSLCLMTATTGRFAVRGQLLSTTYNNRKAIGFFGAPWLFWMSSNCPEVRLGLSDFAPQDVQLDQLFFMTTEKQMVADLETLNKELTDAKDELQEAHDAQHRFFAQMSHEMRTPLNGVVSALSLLEESPSEGRRQQLFSLAKSSSRNLMDVINYVLDLSKLELVGEDGEDAVNLVELIRSTIDIVQAKAREKSLELSLELAPDIPQVCRVNAPRLRQVLLNLLMNAIKFTDAGSVTVRVRMGAGEFPECTLKFSVIDTGIGIDSEVQGHIFDPFWSMQSGGGEHPDAGTGLGLDIVRRNVDHIGGEIGVISERGKGSTFWFDWPTTEAPGDAVASAATGPFNAVDSNIQLSGRILLVDDNETNLLLGTMILESMGLDVCSAENGEGAVAAALNGDFDLVLMDIHMPDFDGLEATRRIREMKGKDVLPIVALTALAYEKEKEACLAIGMNGYLTKPIVKHALAEELGRWLPGKERDPSAGSTGVIGEESLESPASVELLDQVILDDLKREIGSDNLKLVLTKVLDEAAQRWEELICADNSGDELAIQRHVHSLSSIFRSVGLTTAGEAFASIEEQLRSGSSVNAGWIQQVEAIKIGSLKVLRQQLLAS